MHLEKIEEYRLSGLHEYAGAVVICKVNTHTDTIAAWDTARKNGVLPVFIPFATRVDDCDNVMRETNATAVIEVDGAKVIIVPTGNKYTSGKVISFEPGAAIHVTSASTGNPKIVYRSNANLVEEAKRYITELKITDDDVILSTAPLYHSYGFTSAMITAEISHARLIDPGLILPRKILKLCETEGVTILHGAPFLYAKLIESAKGHTLGKRMRLCIASGGAMIEGLQARFEKAFGIPLLQQYGSSETGSLSLSEPGDSWHCVGKAFSGVSFELKRNESGRDEVFVSTPQTIGAYVVGGEILYLPKNGYRMGDHGGIDETGRLLLFGRADDIVDIAGKKVSLKSVENVVRQYIGVTYARCTFVQIGDRGEIHMSYSATNDIDHQDLYKHCRNHMPEYHIPARFIRTDQSTESCIGSWKREPVPK